MNEMEVTSMKQLKKSKFIVILLLSGALCSSCSTAKPMTKVDNRFEKITQADKMVVLALQYHDQAGFEKCSELFLNAADIYRTSESIDNSRRAHLAAAKCHLKTGNKDEFLLTMDRYRIFLPPLQMPSEDERFLIDLADSMNKKPLTYPPLLKWEGILR